MTIPVSTIASVISYLQTAVTAQFTSSTADQAIQLVIGDPGTDRELDIIIIGAQRMSYEPATFVGNGGQFWLEEQCELDVLISCWTGAGDNPGEPLTLLDRAWTLAGYVTTAIRSDPTAGGLLNVWYPMTADTPGPEWAEDGGQVVEIPIVVKYENLN